APTGIRIRPAEAGDLEAIHAIYDGYNRGRPIAVERSAAYWRDWIGLTEVRLARPDGMRVAVNGGGRVVGYITVHANFYNGHQITEDYAYVSELGVLGGQAASGAHVAASDEDQRTCRAVAFALLRAAAEMARAAGKQELHVSIALDPAVRSAAERLFETSTEDATRGCMARLLSHTGLLRSLLMEWNGRWLEAGRPECDTAFETPYGPVLLKTQGRLLEVEAVDSAASALSQAELFRLLFATALAAEIGRSPAERRLFEALFPPFAGVYYGADGF
ncbi:MAG TPA: hypothetical protein VKT77_22010, partial [Chthonomonadaceae bacterium]|nr:hypothetical protein [Chthonomonadaceae bacterium]